MIKLSRMEWEWEDQEDKYPNFFSETHRQQITPTES
jgi:hypothetical protein